MKSLTLFGLLAISLSLTGCQLTHVEGEVDGVNIKASTNGDYDDHHHGSKGSFCPPGQAKKGRC
ncbi:hypothetical protein [Photobacterium halotolerans]|uniref:Lipoprotein n=1 Tax=Photobacterium halotolerans TaxID=265726 RepID=A0A7X4WUX3_9GAMM|nr:hypothetical protein [Photobacterium halotolerans]NAW64416.1 hypothetical protein [Photobacterium halotolerans]NAW87956.1 hypothetical protein [Photobacterium halotolerans]NAX47378.1 hypothetical protein [Photobacterium halotolerans]